MKKITLSSINANLPRLDTLRRSYRLHEWTGVFPSGIQTFSRAFADYDGNGNCTEIRTYAYGDAMERRHYYGTGDTADVTDIIEDWMRGEYDRAEVCRRIQSAIDDQETEET